MGPVVSVSCRSTDRGVAKRIKAQLLVSGEFTTLFMDTNEKVVGKWND